MYKCGWRGREVNKASSFTTSKSHPSSSNTETLLWHSKIYAAAIKILDGIDRVLSACLETATTTMFRM
jgi:hypothetical protein